MKNSKFRNCTCGRSTRNTRGQGEANADRISPLKNDT